MSEGKNGSMIKLVGSILALIVGGLSVFQINARITSMEQKIDLHTEKKAHATAVEHFRAIDRMTWDQEERIRRLEQK